MGWILLAVCILIVAFGTLVPGWLYNRIPVATAFRGLKDGRHPWKRWLLAVEFASVGLLFLAYVIVLLAVVLATVAINCYKVANSNPVEYLKQE